MPIHKTDKLRDYNDLFNPDSRARSFGPSFETNFKIYYEELTEITLSKNVPLGIRIDFETVKNTLLYSIFSYRLSTVAFTYAYATFEKSLRMRFQALSSSLNNEDDRERFNKAIDRCRGLKSRIKLALKCNVLSIDDFCPNIPHISEVSMEVKEEILNIFIQNRNDFAHGTVQLDIVWKAPSRLRFIADLINQLWR